MKNNSSNEKLTNETEEQDITSESEDSSTETYTNFYQLSSMIEQLPSLSSYKFSKSVDNIFILPNKKKFDNIKHVAEYLEKITRKIEITFSVDLSFLGKSKIRKIHTF